MNKKDIGEIRRRLTLEHNNVTRILGCYVNGQRQIISAFAKPVVGMPQEEAEKYLSIFKRVLSGVQGQNLLDIDFTPQQVLGSDEHKLLMALRDTALKDDQAADAFFQRVMENLDIEDNSLILLMHDGYDVPMRAKDGARIEDASTEIFNYFICAVCPVKLTKPALSYFSAENEFHSRDSDWIVGAPEMGFMFPAFEQRSANIYGALFYTRDTALSHDGFVAAALGAQLPMPADAQREAFTAVLQDTLMEECSYDVVQSVHERVLDKMEAQKEDKGAAPLKITKRDVKEVLEECGVSQDRLTAFDDKYDEQFGFGDLEAVNIVSPKQYEVRTPNVVIKVAPEHSDLIETRVIDGLNYILIRADEGVELNGVSVSIRKED